MAINFAAANMVGYNNPKIKIIPVTIDTDAVINPPELHRVKQHMQKRRLHRRFYFLQYYTSAAAEYRRRGREEYGC